MHVITVRSYHLVKFAMSLRTTNALRKNARNGNLSDNSPMSGATASRPNSLF